MAPSQSHLEWAIIAGDNIVPSPNSPVEQLASSVQQGNIQQIFSSPLTKSVLTSKVTTTESGFHSRLQDQITAEFGGKSEEEEEEELLPLLLLGIAALNAFIQSNVTGPPLLFLPEDVLLPSLDVRERQTLGAIIIQELSVEGEAAYHLIPHPILFGLARGILSHPLLEKLETGRWWRLRANFMHQRMLEGEKTGILHDVVYKDLTYLSSTILQHENKWVKAKFLVEKAGIDTYFGYDKVALQGLETAAGITGLQYALTGVMGKRTKFQERDISQLVVIAKSAEDYQKPGKAGEEGKDGAAKEATKPTIVDLNCDTLLDSIAFVKEDKSQSTTIREASDLPKELAELDPGEQPPLHPLDATILLLLVETIKNTNPDTGITREEMAPYAERVLKYSTNWEVYTIALLVRCRLETHKSRTVERGVLQLQALVDQVIAETTLSTDGPAPSASTFLPRPTSSEETATVKERLEYVYQLPAPTRWEIEAELAQKWVSLGALRTALEIFERLQMWAEVALCYAATDKEETAKRVIRNQLLTPITPPEGVDAEDYKPTQEEEGARTFIDPPPANAPRLWAILGDIDDNPEDYERAWTVSNHRYARAKRSLGSHWFKQKEFLKSAEAYADSLNVNQLNSSSWFSLGCCRIELEDWEGAVEAFQKTTMLDDTDAEAWSNLATVLLRRRTWIKPKEATAHADGDEDLDEEASGEAVNEEGEVVIDVGRNRREALKALKKACSLKYDNWRMFSNMLVIAASVSAFNDVVMAMSRIIELRGDSAGESCVDTEILERLVQHVITTSDPEPAAPSNRNTLLKATTDLVEKKVVPLITKNERLWVVCSRLALFRRRPKEALEAQEKAFRAVSHGFDVGERTWKELVEATTEMVDSYTNLGEMEREGLASGSGELVAKNWRFKARSIVRTVMGKGKLADKEGDEWYTILETTAEGLKL
ncbi:hypothetical protein DFH27DRAFT_576475 [Peziza echinospora]|nr:hypothetical protein DFH27DRAFT_576475 [Peziza echinospora]